MTKITADWLTQTTAEKGQRVEKMDPSCPGLRIRISEGAKSFAFVHRPKGGKVTTVTLGHFPDMSLTAARKQADKHRVAAGAGQDVRGEKRAAVAASALGQMTFSALVDIFMVWAKTNKRSWEADQRHLDHFTNGWPDGSGQKRLTAWGRRAAASITRGEIADALNKIASGAPVSANRHHATLHKLFQWAIAEGKWPEGRDNPMRGMIKRTDENDRERERNLSPAELKKVWAELTNPSSEIGATTRDALRVILLTAQRPGEVSGMLSEELKLSDKPATWTIPKARAKNKVGAHVIPLTAPALDIIKANLADREEPVAVFESRTFGDRAMSRHTLPHACADIAVNLKLEHFVAHDLRRTAATLMRAAGVPPFVVEDVLGHLPPKLVRTYQAHDPVPERLAALETLARRIREITSSRAESGQGRSVRTSLST